MGRWGMFGWRCCRGLLGVGFPLLEGFSELAFSSTSMLLTGLALGGRLMDRHVYDYRYD